MLLLFLVVQHFGQQLLFLNVYLFPSLSILISKTSWQEEFTMQRPKNTRDVKNQHLLEVWCINLNLEQARPVTQRL